MPTQRNLEWWEKKPKRTRPLRDSPHDGLIYELAERGVGAKVRIGEGPTKDKAYGLTTSFRNRLKRLREAGEKDANLPARIECWVAGDGSEERPFTAVAHHLPPKEEPDAAA